LSRVLGGSLRGQQIGHVIADAELNRLVRELLRTVPASPSAITDDRVPAAFATLAPNRHHIRARGKSHTLPICDPAVEIHPAEIDLEPAISVKKNRYTPSRSLFVDWVMPLALSVISISAFVTTAPL
jgi:hypothetical protein